MTTKQSGASSVSLEVYDENRIKQAHERKARIIALLKKSAYTWLKVGILIREATEGDPPDFKVLGYRTETEYFLHELNLPRSTALHFRQSAEKWGHLILNNRLEPPPISRIIKLNSLQIPEEQKLDWLHKALTLPPPAFADEIREAKGQQPRDTCDHSDITWGWGRCNKCGKWLRNNNSSFPSDTDSPP